ncbi:MAG: nicotinate phosphoribosyltransferase [Tenacibaculum sp.]|nr:nicotinate phosphoribosyltransferase [Tenacibaculum sp.]
MIQSILDNDFYKLTMQCAVINLFPNRKANYEFINRGKHKFPEGFDVMLKWEISKMQNLKLTKEEQEFLLKTCPYLPPTYVDFLKGYRYDPNEILVEQSGNDLKISISGYWYRTILWEVPLLFLISELYYKITNAKRKDDKYIIESTKNKLKTFDGLGIKFAEFGTRRRHSFEVQNLVTKTLTETPNNSFIGTSNVYLAMKNNIKPIGTHAHEWFMFHAAEYGFKMANSMSLENWSSVYRGDLGVALSDTYTTEVFFKQFDKKFSKLFDGVRHDSGDPIEFANKTIEHYKRLGINPLYKYIVFSDGLNSEKVTEITNACKGKIGISFGIGTSLTNDTGLKPMNIVIKLTKVLTSDNEWVDTVKLSDEPNKNTGTDKMILLAKELLGLTNKN